MTEGLSRTREDIAAFLLGQWAKTVPWIMLETYGLAIWSKQLVNTPAIAGTLVLLTMIVHATLDLLIGSQVDRLMPSKVRMLAVLGLVTGVPLLILAIGVPPSVSLWMCVLAFFLLRSSYAAFDVPHNAWMTSLVRQAGDAGWLASGRLMATFLATMTVAMLGQRLLAPEGTVTIWLAVVVALLWGLGCAPAASRLTARAPIVSRSEVRALSSWQWLRDKEVVLLLLLTAANVILLAFTYASFAFFAQERLADIRWAGWVVGAVASGKIAALPAWGIFRGSRWRAMGAAFGLCALGAAMLAVSTNRALFLLAAGLLGAGAGGINVTSWSLLPPLANRLDLTHGEVSARLTAGFTAITKVATGVGALVLSLTLPFGSSQAVIDIRFALVSAAFLVCFGVIQIFARGIAGSTAQVAS
ncbi:hypothetical protein CAF53_01625 [Sphingobium sp. LB126]|uniref:MFS transporter n=1 Tax=Sphingobium sp. LB126 TaxID=1983755 RepID=UPI000C2001FE|nr:MFS transporter [Sphingobium sp. LB126]PJG47076.1 hypothetical protein CAF53_01625 [Sphingobium sp. LB126]